MLRTHFLTELATVGHRKQRDGHGPLPSGWVLLIGTKMGRCTSELAPFSWKLQGTLYLKMGTLQYVVFVGPIQ